MAIVCFFASLIACSINSVLTTNSAKVLGGKPTTITQYPIMAQMLLDSWGNQQFSQHCAGVILTVRHVISTAHCYQYNPNTGRDYSLPAFWKVRVGSSYRNRGGYLHNVKSINSHQEFDKTYFKNDITVITVSKAFAINGYVKQGTIPKYGLDVKGGSIGTLVGWGVTMNGGAQPDQLQYVNIEMIDNQECQSRYDNISAVISEGMMCGGRLDIGGVDGCFGDSGGPLIYNGVVVGLISFGYSCGHYYFPGVYARVSYYTNWILSVIYSN